MRYRHSYRHSGLSPQAMNAQTEYGRRFSTLSSSRVRGFSSTGRGASAIHATIHEHVQFPAGFVDLDGAPQIRSVRIEQAAVFPQGETIRRDERREMNYETPLRGTQPQNGSAPQESEFSTLEGWLEGKRVALRPVGKTRQDETGNVYEVRDRQLYQLGQMVADEQGRMFEVLHTSRAAKLGKDTAAYNTGGEETGEPPSARRAAEHAQTDGSAPPHQSRARGQTQTKRSYSIQAQDKSSAADPALERPSRSTGRRSTSQETPSALKRSVPRPYLEGAQFRHSREEVLYDMHAPLGSLAPEANALTYWCVIHPLRLLKSWSIRLWSRSRIKKWRAMLSGKSPEEQLWQVPPPHGFSCHPAIREWAAERLAWAGYDPELMFFEWEIFWRRKGWQ